MRKEGVKGKKTKPAAEGQKLTVPRFYHVPDIDSLPEDSPLKAYFSGARKRKQTRKKDKRMRYAAYVRISSEEQVIPQVGSTREGLPREHGPEEGHEDDGSQFSHGTTQSLAWIPVSVRQASLSAV